MGRRGSIAPWAGRTAAAAALGWLAALATAPDLAAATGRVTYAFGTVEVHRAGRTLEAEPGLELGGGDVVETGRDGTAILQLAGRVELKLRENTRLSLDSLEEAGSRVGLAPRRPFSRGAGRPGAE